MDFKPLDIVLTRDAGFLSRVIIFFIGGWSHVAIFIDNVFLVHADGGMVRATKIEKFFTPGTEYKILRYDAIPDIDRDKLRADAVGFIGKEYDLTGIVGRLLSRLFAALGITVSASWLNHPQKYFCSEMVGEIFKKQGILIRGKEPATLEPADFGRSTFFFEVSRGRI